MSQDLLQYFRGLLEDYFRGSKDRANIHREIWTAIGIDEVKEKKGSLVVACEWALRHIDDAGHRTSEAELAYLLRCLSGRHTYSDEGRDRAIAANSHEERA
jgi:hypothetical protein